MLVRFSRRLQESEESEMQPVWSYNGVTYLYLKVRAVNSSVAVSAVTTLTSNTIVCRVTAVAVQHNNVYILGVTKKNSNVTMILAFLSQLVVVRA